MIGYVALGLSIFYIGFLFAERVMLKKYRKKIKHVIHVNGIRGKSTVTRLIGSVLRDAGFRTFTKVTGTKPMVIDCEGNEVEIKRMGPANIREQMHMVRRAAKQHADILVIECMAIKKEYQAMTQDVMLDANIGVITNIRKDHTEEFGESLTGIADALSATIPTNGQLYVFEETRALLEPFIEKKQANVHLVDAFAGDESIDFYAENIAIALKVAASFGIDQEKALKAMRNYHRDVGALSIYQWDDTYFVNGFSINDVDSILNTLNKLIAMPVIKERPLTVLINNRMDRPKRAMEHIELLKQLNPPHVIVIGGFLNKTKKALPNSIVEAYHGIEQLNKPFMFAFGNIRKYGYQIIAYIEEKGTKYYG